MKKAIVFLGLVMVVMVLVLGSCTKAEAQSLGSVRWEYTFVNTAGSSNTIDVVMQSINSLGGEGWEVVTGFDGYYTGLILKRRLP